MKKLQTRKSQTSQRFQRLIFSTARPTGSIGQEHNLQKKTSSKTGEKLTIQQIMSTAERR